MFTGFNSSTNADLINNPSFDYSDTRLGDTTLLSIELDENDKNELIS